MDEVKNLPEQIQHSVDIFASSEIPEDRRAALSAIIAAKFLPKNADEAKVLCGRDRWLHEAGSHPEASRRLLAIAESIRLAQVVQRWLPITIKALEASFHDELPALDLLSDADDRLNVARACALFHPAWLPQYLARSIANEEQGEKTRSELISALINCTPTLAEAFTMLAQEFSKIKPNTQSPADTVAKRLTRTLVALRAHLVESDTPAGLNCGKSIHALISESFWQHGKPQDEKAIFQLGEEVLLTVHDMLRTRLSLVAEADMYLAVAYVRTLFDEGRWPEKLGKTLAKLTADVSEALVLLGRQGTRDQTLLDQLMVLARHPERARFIAKELALHHPELDEEVRDWLEHGRIRNGRQASGGAVEVAAATADVNIGLALHAARTARQGVDGLKERLVSSLEVYEPTLVSVTVETLNRITALAVQIEQVATVRNIELFGVVGKETEATSKFFEIVGEVSKQRMIVHQPAIVRTRSDGVVGDVLLRGLVG